MDTKQLWIKGGKNRFSATQKKGNNRTRSGPTSTLRPVFQRVPGKAGADLSVRPYKTVVKVQTPESSQQDSHPDFAGPEHYRTGENNDSFWGPFPTYRMELFWRRHHRVVRLTRANPLAVLTAVLEHSKSSMYTKYHYMYPQFWLYSKDTTQVFRDLIFIETNVKNNWHPINSFESLTRKWKTTEVPTCDSVTWTRVEVHTMFLEDRGRNDESLTGQEAGQ